MGYVKLSPAGATTGQIFYLDTTDAADVSGYKRMLLTPSPAVESSLAVICTGTTSDFLIGSFITDAGVPGAIDYPAGSAYRRLYGKVSGGTAKFRLQVYVRTAGGTETLVRDEFSNDFTDTVPTLQEWLATPAAGGALSTSDRIVVKISARRVTGPTNVTVTLYGEGSAHASQIQTTIPLSASVPVSATPPISISGGNISIDLSAYAPLASPALTGNPTAPTPTAGDNDTSIATTAFVTSAVTAAGGSGENDVIEYANLAAFPATGTAGLIYVAQDTNKIYRWDAPAAITAVTWDAATVTAVTLSGGDLVATNTGTTSADQGARVATVNGKTSGKYYFEVVYTTAPTTGGLNRGVGIGTTTSTYTNMGGGGTTGVFSYYSGGIWSNGGSVGTLGPRGATDTICIAADLDTRKFWVKSFVTGNWNGNNSLHNPSTGLGGFTIPAGTMVPFVTFGGTSGVANNVFTANFGASAFSGAVPSGFTAGWTV